METLPLDMLLSLGLGMAFSLGQGEKEMDKASAFGTIYFRVGLAFHLVVAFGVALLCYILYPDWMLMYFSDHRRVPAAVTGYIFCGYFAMYTLGFLSVPHLREVKRGLPLRVFLGVLGTTFAFIGLTFRRLWQVGSFDEYHAGNAPPVTRTALFPILGVSMPLAIGGLVGVMRALDKRFD